MLISKWMKELEKNFYGAVSAYDNAMQPDAAQDELARAIWRYLHHFSHNLVHLSCLDLKSLFKNILVSSHQFSTFVIWKTFMRLLMGILSGLFLLVGMSLQKMTPSCLQDQMLHLYM